ncbi:MAG: helix-turn-helix domain-containing protein [Clostridiales bacterium]|jgi:transcriptional regulator with XRE-family HTH domain|nr:helix-turn-helix domain-containing protein [Clostridiales bacterium]
MQIDYLDIGKRIRAERLKQKVTQEKLAEMTGVGTTHISHIETGNSKLSIKAFVSIVNALNISADELFRNHIAKSKHVLAGEMAEVMADCTDDEARVITDAAIAIKTSLRKSSRK